MSEFTVKLWCVVAVVVVGACGKSRPQAVPYPAGSRVSTAPDSKEAALLSESEKSVLVEKAIKVAVDRGISTAGLEPSVAEWKTWWNVSFTAPVENGKTGGRGFVVRIEKVGKSDPQILKFQ
jgi:hypothetical protein